MTGARRIAALALAALLPMAALHAQEYPGKPVKIVVPFPPGGSTDVAARILAAKLAEGFRQPVYVENKPGAGTTIGAAYVASSAPDGYTLYVTGPITHASSQALYKKLPYDALRGFAPVGNMTVSPFIVVVHPASPAKSLKDLLEAARRQPGRLSYASSGNGAAPHLVTEIIARAAGVSFTHVPFKGVGPAVIALLGNQVDFMIADVAVVPQIREGKLRALALTTAAESPLVPGVPSMVQAGMPGVDVPSGLALFAPAGTPEAVVARINAEMNRALQDADVRQKFAMQGFEIQTGTPADLAAMMAREVERYGQVVRQTGISID
ncbi:Bug family tripartite tricarboxylate transporter substrate binding protein [Pigmentiphaga kullae]|uniref:Tripartite-type tricarboxylate transporter receptor subunit TctC n=1 Tax=Pigmentiphaga kullae TaxID=151784 RepID=A0A4Q7NM42_9BURK|nr:tripartite tricarboxylate transporter substrate binding protein [Pigmentiphaga kullae]RZS86244.1 tripartite-type tricarboxylate transporter receptor subunit TctC [Pigmentiphaga kullae]